MWPAHHPTSSMTTIPHQILRPKGEKACYQCVGMNVWWFKDFNHVVSLLISTTIASLRLQRTTKGRGMLSYSQFVFLWYGHIDKNDAYKYIAMLSRNLFWNASDLSQNCIFQLGNDAKQKYWWTGEPRLELNKSALILFELYPHRKGSLQILQECFCQIPNLISVQLGLRLVRPLCEILGQYVRHHHQITKCGKDIL